MREGTRRHHLAAECLMGIVDKDSMPSEDWEHVEYYVTQVRAQAEHARRFWVERTYQHECLRGTPDAVLVLDDELQIHDMKFAHGKTVAAENNKQLLCYALLVLKSIDQSNIERIRLLIHQGRHTDEWVIEDWIPVMTAFSDRVHRAVKRLTEPGHPPRIPSPNACHYCSAKHACPELAQYVQDHTTEDSPYDQNAKQNAVELVRRWADAVESASYAMLQAGEELADWKLVAGRRPARAWTSENEAEVALKSCRLKADEMYTKKLIGPAPAEKLLKDRPRSWAKVEPLITQGKAKPTLAKKDDKRPAIVPGQDFFENLTQ